MHTACDHPKRVPLATIKLCVILCMLLNVVQHPRAVKATDDVANVSPCELESIINQLVNPNPEYQLHASALRTQLGNILRDRQLPVGEEQPLGDYDYPEEDKRSVAALAAQGLLRPGTKRSLATLAKNGQLPTPDPEDNDSSEPNEEKRYVGALARSGGFMGYGKRNIGSLARDFQLPQNGKRNLATLARLGLLTTKPDPKRNLAAVARYNSNRYANAGKAAAAEKRNLGALKGSPVHGGLQQKRDDDEMMMALPSTGAGDLDYADAMPNYWLYPGYADLDWGDFSAAVQKRFLDTSKDPELFGIENGNTPEMLPDEDSAGAYRPQQQKRHIGAVYRSGFLPTYRALRSTTGSTGGGRGSAVVGGGRFSRSGRARQFVEYYPQRERLRQPIAAVCKRCFLPYRPIVQWGAAGIRGRLPKFISDDDHSSILTNSLPSSSGRRHTAYTSAGPTASLVHSWGTPPRITALHRRAYRRQDNNDNNFQY